MTEEARARRVIPSPRCPHCGWHLAFLPYSIVYANPLRLWEAYCPNPDEKVCSFESHGSVGPVRVVTVEDAVYVADAGPDAFQL
jgi:hypothetical protein